MHSNKNGFSYVMADIYEANAVSLTVEMVCKGKYAKKSQHHTSAFLSSA